jgi:hypothetical protein
MRIVFKKGKKVNFKNTEKNIILAKTSKNDLQKWDFLRQK